MTANWFAPLRRGRVQGLVISGAAIGAALSPILTTGVVGAYGWQTSFQLAAAATLVLSLLWLWLAQDRPPIPPVEPDSPATGPLDATPAATEVFPLWQLLKNRNLGILTAGYFCLNYFEYIFFYWIYYYFGEIRKMGSEESGVYTTIMMVTMAVMTPFGGWVSDRLVSRFGKTAGLRAVPIAGLGLSAILLYAGAREDLGVFAVVAVLAASFGLATATEGAYWAAAIEVSGVHPGAGGGIMNSVGNVGGLLSPVLTPMLAARFGWAAGLHFASLLIGLSVVAWFFFRPEQGDNEPRPPAQQPPNPA
jgi:ACS family glucarate transporter-like MFS transporter